MVKVVVAAVLSVTLHGFLLTQWPSPFVRVPVWRSEELLRVTYLPAPPPKRGSASQKASKPPPASGVTLRRTGLSVPSVDTGPDRSRSLASSATPPDGLGTMPARAPSATIHGGAPVTPLAGAPDPDVSMPPPSFLTPADVARFTYKQRVRAQLKRALAYPAEAISRSGLPANVVWRGAVRLRLQIGRDGRVRDAACLAADAPVFAQATLAGVAAAGRFPQVPAEVPEPATYEFIVAYQPGAETSVSP